MTDKQVIERERFAVLVHVYTLAQATLHASVSKYRIIRDLGLPQKSADQTLATLMKIGFVEWSVGEEVQLTERGIDYIEHGARRRRSVRL